MNQEAIHYIMQRMSGWLDNRQMVVLQNTLDESVKLTGDREAEKTTAELLDAFIATKRLEGRSEGTIELYLYNIRAVLNYSEKNACVMTTDDIRQCLALCYGQAEQREDVAQKVYRIIPTILFPFLFRLSCAMIQA